MIKRISSRGIGRAESDSEPGASLLVAASYPYHILDNNNKKSNAPASTKERASGGDAVSHVPRHATPR